MFCSHANLVNTVNIVEGADRACEELAVQSVAFIVDLFCH